MLTRARLRLVFFFCKVLSTDEQLSRYLGGGSLGSTRRCRIVYLQGTVVETGAFHYCFPSVKFDLFSYPLLATETNHALIYFPFFVVVFFFGYTTIWKGLSVRSIQLQAGTTPLKGWGHLIDFFFFNLIFFFSLCLFFSSDYLKHQQEKCCCASNDWK